MKKISILLLTIICLQVFSQAPQGMNYQAVVRDALGNPITNHAIGVKFKIHQGSGSGTVVYEETQTPTSDPFGSISLVIGQGSVVTGVFANINWSSGIYFNEVLIDVSGGNSYLSMGASQLMSVPYSLYSEKTNEHQTLSINGNNLVMLSG